MIRYPSKSLYSKLRSSGTLNYLAHVPLRLKSPLTISEIRPAYVFPYLKRDKSRFWSEAGQIPLKVRNFRCKLWGSRNIYFPQPKVLLGSPTIRLCECVFQAIIWANVTVKNQRTALKVRAAAVNWNPTDGALASSGYI
jgi:hypothetical protein